MRGMSLAVLMLVAGCDTGPVSQLLDPFPDTLAGYRLGMSLPDVRDQAEALGDSFECDYQLDDQFVFCGPSADFDSGRDRLDFGFRDGQLILITQNLGEDWDDVPFDTLRARLGVYGDLPAQTADTAYSWQTTEQNTTVQVSCGSQGSRCSVVLGRSGQ